MKTFKSHLEEAKTPKDLKFGKHTFKYNKKDSDEGGLIAWIQDVQQKTKAWTDDMFGDDEGQEKYFDKPIIGPMEKAFEKHFKKMGYKWDISS